ncbi:MAG TPA: macro domain-containing protein [Leptolinea sp.]
MSTYIFNNLTVLIAHGDITLQNVDAIVNAANSHLLHGGGVASAIVNRGGSSIQQESDEWVKIHGLVTHDHPAITGAGLLPCQYVIHAVGPVWGDGDETQKLIKTVRASLIVANDLKCGSVAFPAISTGIFRFPLELAARCFLSAVSEFASENILFFLHTVKIILVDKTACRIFLNVFSQKENQ